MYLSELHLENFRIYQKKTWKFSPGINHIIGSNAKGKTTILEAINFLICGRSFRTPQVRDLIRKGEDCFFIEANFVKNGIDQKLKIACSKEQKKIVFNNTILSSTANLLGHIYGTIFTPDDANLIKGAPSVRRQFLDLQIAQGDPLYVHYLTRFLKAMRQRNCLLRFGNDATIEGWEEQMANAAEYLWKKREETVEILRQRCEPMYHMMSDGREALNIKYKSSFVRKAGMAKGEYMQALRSNRSREKELGYTILGPHKDDLLFSLEEGEVRYFGSEGQQRSSVASLRFSEWSRLETVSGLSPLMLIDDVGISLDATRRKVLCKHLESLGQVFLTSTEAFDEIEIGDNDSLIRVS